MHLLAPAKINLHLRVAPPRGDGFHPILTWMCTVGLFDELEITPHAAMQLTCTDVAIPCDEKNLVFKAAAALGVAAKIHLTKRIPAGGGLAGGSSDAARTLLGINRLCGLNLPSDELVHIASRLGSDIAFFLFGPSGVCSGLGEKVQPIAVPAARWAVLILPPFAMPTPRVYRRFDELKLGKEADIIVQPDWNAWAKLPALKLLEKLVNDLEAAAFDLNPRLRELHQNWQQRLGRPVRMSGSGSTLFTLYDTRAAADAAAGIHSLSVVQLAPDLGDDLSDGFPSPRSD